MWEIGMWTPHHEYQGEDVVGRGEDFWAAYDAALAAARAIDPVARWNIAYTEGPNPHSFEVIDSCNHFCTAECRDGA